MFFIKEPTMDVDVVAIMKNDHGYMVAIQKASVGNMQICVEDESILMGLIAELVEGDVDYFAKKEEKGKVELTN